MIIPDDYSFYSGEWGFWVLVTHVDPSEFHNDGTIAYTAEIRSCDEAGEESIEFVKRPVETSAHPEWDENWWDEIEADLQIHYVDWGPEESPVHDSDFLPRGKS